MFLKWEQLNAILEKNVNFDEIDDKETNNKKVSEVQLLNRK